MRQSRSELLEQLRTKFKALQLHGKSFDEGHRDVEAPSLAVHVRVLVHDTNNSVSLLTLLGVKDQLKFSATPGGQHQGGKWSHLTRMAIHVIDGRPEARYDPFLDTFPKDEWDLAADMPRMQTMKPGEWMQSTMRKIDWVEVDFAQWWGHAVLWDDAGRTLSRRELTLGLANKDGGAHVDEELGAAYAAFSRQNALGWQLFHDTPDGVVRDETASDRPERGCMRQIAFELERTLSIQCTELLAAPA